MREELPRNPPPNDDWIMKIGTELKKTSPISSSWSIYKVQPTLRSVNEVAYSPQLVSIGPFHHGEEKLKPMEDYKRLFLRFLFQRTRKPEEEILKDCCNAILALDKDVRDCYAEQIKHDEYQHAKILYDAGFMLELFLKFWPWSSREQRNQIFIPSWMLSSLTRDLVLLENQIPLFVLKSLFEIIALPVGDSGPQTLEVLALTFLRAKKLNISYETLKNRGTTGKHLLHLLHDCYLPSDPLNSKSVVAASYFIPCATSLRQAGVVFQKNTTNDFFDFKFEEGTFKIPPLYTDDDTDSLFRNLAAFEQCQPSREQYFTSYLTLMDQLIDTKKDVELLQQKEIIQSDLGRGEDVSNLFNNLGKELTYSHCHYAELCKKVNAYADSRCHRYIAALRRDYFKYPWSIISFVAGVILLVLTLFQTLYTVSSYYHRR